MQLKNLFGLNVANKGPIERWRQQFGFLLCSRTCCMRWCHILLRLLLMKTSILLLLDSSSVICLWVTYPSVTHVFAYRINYWPSISACSWTTDARWKNCLFTALPKIKSQSHFFRYGRSIFCLPHRPKISEFLDLCLHWVFVVREHTYFLIGSQNKLTANFMGWNIKMI